MIATRHVCVGGREQRDLSSPSAQYGCQGRRWQISLQCPDSAFPHGRYESTSSEEEEEDSGDSSSEKISPTSSDSDAEGDANTWNEEIGVNPGETASSVEGPEPGTEQRKRKGEHELRTESAPAVDSTEVKEK